MSIALLYYKTFYKSLTKLDTTQLITTEKILAALKIYLLHNANLEKAKEVYSGFFYKQLRKPYFEAGIESRLRILMEKDSANVYAVFAGNHNQIRRFLSSH